MTGRSLWIAGLAGALILTTVPLALSYHSTPRLLLIRLLTYSPSIDG